MSAFGGGADLTARFNALREVLHNEITAVELLLGARINGVDTQREILLGGLNDQSAAMQDQVDRRLNYLQLQIDQRFSADRETLAALKEMLNERYATQTKALDAAFKAAEQAVAVALANAEKATIKAEMASDKRFEAVNEFRQVLTDQTATFLPRTEYDTARDALSDRIETNANRVSTLELRLTSRLDRGEGADAASAATILDQRALSVLAQTSLTDRATAARANLSLIIAAVTGLVAVIVGIIVIVKG